LGLVFDFYPENYAHPTEQIGQVGTYAGQPWRQIGVLLGQKRPHCFGEPHFEQLAVS
jgi:hypothetical protein